MRITNNMMITNTMNGVNVNKVGLDKLYSQMVSQKRIQRPSEDPIVALRALRLRSTLNEIDQYLNKNIPDAEAWLEVTEDALGSIMKIVSDIMYYCTQGANDTLDDKDRTAIITTLNVFRQQIYEGANADYAGRTIFTGHRTNQLLTFDKDELETSYNITQRLSLEDFDTVTKIVNSVDVDNLAVIPFEEMPMDNVVNRCRLAYDSLDEGTLVLTYPGGAPISYEERLSSDPDAYLPADGEVIFLVDTGELIFGKSVMEDIIDEGGIVVSYDKTGFVKGELRPLHYFDCIDNVTGVEYVAEDQPIEYAINFNQRLTVNTQGKDVFTHAMARDIDELIDAVSRVEAIQVKISSIEKNLLDPVYQSPEQQEALNSMLDALKKEFDLAEDLMQKQFGHAITQFQKVEEKLNLAMADIGAKGVRLTLNEARLTSQYESVEELKSINEDMELSDVAISFSALQSVYDASLMAAGKVVQTRLIDFLR